MRALSAVLTVIGLGAAAYCLPAVSPGILSSISGTRLERFLPAGFLTTSKADTISYVLVPVGHGDIVTTVTATGALSAITTVLVSSQVSGQLLRILADYNAEVQKGDVIAEIDPLSFQIALEQAESELRVAESQVSIYRNLLHKAVADLASARSVIESAGFAVERERILFVEAQRNLERKRSLVATRDASQVEFTKAQVELDTASQKLKGAEAEERTKVALAQAAEATLNSVQAQIDHALSVVSYKKASVKAAAAALERTKIRSPTNGIVIGRKIEEGQQVTVTLQTQTLFTVAQDLQEMQIKISVDEADIGRIREGQSVTFTVDSYPGREFHGEVKQIRQDPQEKQNVVTYVVVANTSNPDKILMPGMTANARIVIAAKRGVLKVPAAALRFVPAGETSPAQSHVWTLGDDQRPKPVPVEVGLSDGQTAEVKSDEAVEQVIIGVNRGAPAPTRTRRIIGSM